MAVEPAKKILVIDDDPTVVTIVKTFLKEATNRGQVEIQQAASGEEGLHRTLDWLPHLAFCDVRMPGLDGFEVTRRIREKGLATAVVLFSACSEQEFVEFTQRAQQAGAEAFLAKPPKAHEIQFLVNYVVRMESAVRQARRKNQALEQAVTELNRYQQQITALNDELQKEKERLKTNLDEMVQLNVQLESKNDQILTLNKELVTSFRSTVNMLTNIIELHQTSHRGHPERVEKMSGFVADKLKLPAHQVEHIRTAARLHELGIVSKPPNGNGQGKNKQEDAARKFTHHTLLGEMLLRNYPGFEMTANIIRHLYENVDGTGIPDGLAGNMIPIGSRIVSAASFYDHARVNQPGAQPMGLMKLLENEQGTRYDEDIVSLLGEFIQSDQFKQLDIIECTVFTLQEGMHLASDMVSQSGISVLRKGTVLDKSTLNNVLRFNNLDPIVGTVKVRKV